MNTKITAFLLVFLFLFASTVSAQATSKPDNRYLIKSKAGVWKNSFNVRHKFDNGFTADLTDWQLRLTKIFNIEIEKVQRLYVSPAESEIVLSGTPDKSKRITPDAQVPWGVATLYDNSELTETSGGKDITIAVLDTGVAKAHPDLSQRIADCRDFTNTKQGITEGKCEDKNGHGTHVAGIIAADGGKDGKGIYGMAPEVKLLAYKVCDADGSCWADDVAVAIHEAVDEGAEIINVSLGSDNRSALLEEALNYAGDHDVLVVAAAGNDGDYVGSIDFPAAHLRAVSVGAVDDKNDIPDWSSRGANEDTDEGELNDKDLQFGAPGVNVESTWKDGYAILSGTSMAAPHITGLAALLWNFEDKHPAQKVRDALEKLARDIGIEGEDNDSGYGMPKLSQ